jgi:hypothetical protein
MIRAAYQAALGILVDFRPAYFFSITGVAVL